MTISGEELQCFPRHTCSQLWLKHMQVLQLHQQQRACLCPTNQQSGRYSFLRSQIAPMEKTTAICLTAPGSVLQPVIKGFE